MSDLVKIGQGNWVSRRQIIDCISVTAYTGNQDLKMKPHVIAKFPGHESSWSFDDYESAENFVTWLIAKFNSLLTDG